MLTLAPDAVDVWTCSPEEHKDPEQLSRWLSQLDEGERERHKRFVFEEHRHDFLVSHALVRHALSRYVERAPSGWRFVKGEHGRPELEPSCAGPEQLRFNLSHTKGAVIFAVTSGRDIGADVERINDRTSVMTIADRFFSVSEHEALCALPEHQQRRRFFELWTLKESYIKARGMGLAIPLGAFGFSFTPEGLALSVEPSQADDPSRWSFLQWSVSPLHLAALTVDTRRAGLKVLHRGTPWAS